MAVQFAWPTVQFIVAVLFIAFSWTPTSVLSSEAIKNCKPAAITNQTRKTVFFENSITTLQCEADGDPTLKYTWLKDGQEMDLNSRALRGRYYMQRGAGNLVIRDATDGDAGVYQCKVSNPCGTSLSQKTSLLYAHLKPFIRHEPEIVRAFLGRPLKLECTPPESVPEAVISWIKEKEDQGGDDEYYSLYGGEEEEHNEIFNDVQLGRRITMDYLGNLYFISVDRSDSEAGMRYVCMAFNGMIRGSVQGEDKEISIYGDQMNQEPADMMWHSDEHVLALEGERIKFKCIFSGNPIPTVRWRRTDGGVFDEKRMEQSEDQHEFFIKEVHRDDAGTYACTGKNAMSSGPIEQTFTLSVESAPKWTKEPEDLRVGVEDNVTIVCSAHANPEASVAWFINGQPISEAPPAHNRRLVGEVLVLTNVTQEDSQVIQCNASNIHGYLWKDISLQVQALPPSIVKKPLEQKVAKEQSVTVPCQVEGRPRPEVMWYKGNQMLLGQRYQILPSGDLQIQSVNERDSGDYHCIAKNRYGQASAQGSLIVREKTVIMTPPTSDTVSQGDQVIFTCGAVTDNEELKHLNYMWLKDSKPINTNDPRVDVNKGRLQISDSNSGDSGNYTCTASNSLDSDSASATLRVRAPPEPPTSVVLVSCGALEMEVEWTFEDRLSNFSPLEEFIVEFSTAFIPESWEEAVRVPADRRTARYLLSPWTEYSFRVRARNHMGIGDPSRPKTKTCRTVEARPSRNPSDVHTREDKTGHLVIMWEPMPPIDHNAPDFKYLVTWRGMDEEDGQIQSTVVSDWQQDSYEVDVAGVYRPYGITVQAVNAKGKSVEQAQEVIGYSGEAAPTVAPANFELDPEEDVTSTTAAFRWDPVDTSPEVINGKFTGYKIRYWKKGQKEDSLHEHIIMVPEGNQHSRRRRQAWDGKVRGRVSGLPSFSEIEADVVVTNTYFESDGSNMVSLTTPEGVPSRVEYLEALFRGSSHFLLEWGPPAEPNGVLVGYQLGYQKVEGLMVGPVVVAIDDIPADQQRTNLDGLEPNSLYRVFVAAVTRSGPGEMYFIDVRTTDEASELAEPRIESVVAGEKNVNVTFTLAEGQKGKRTGSMYFLEYRKMGEHGWDREREGTTDHFWLTLEDLEPATTYEVRVVSVPRSADRGPMDFQPSQETRFGTTGIGAKKGSFLSAAWFIGMMVAIALLLLILIIVCIVKRNRGKAYTFPPEKDTVDGAAIPFNEPPKHFRNGVNAGMPGGEGEKMPLGEETDSMVEYGDDPAVFNEDGSFIGQYGENKPPPPPPDAPPGYMAHVV